MGESYQNENNQYNNGDGYNNGGYNNGGYNNGNGYNNNNNGGRGPGGPGGTPGGQDPKRQNILLLVLAAIIVMALFSILMNGLSGGTTEVSYSQFVQWVEEDKVASVKVFSDRLEFSLKAEGVGQDEEASSGKHGESAVEKQLGLFGVPTQKYRTIRVEDDGITQRMLDHGVDIQGQTATILDSITYILLSVVLPIGLMWLLLSFLFRKMSKGGGVMGVGKSTAKVYVQKETGVTFKDVAGEDEAKESLVEVVDFLHNPGKYSQIGAKLPKGALLVGPPGTGKTLLAKAVAGEAHVPFFSLAGSDFIELYVGVGASRVRDLFREAEKNAPCIVFIDEIDAIGRSRDSKYGGNEEREQTLNQLLSEMDGFDGKNGIIILAATNRPEILDKALLRPGRFDRRIIVDKPDLKGRVEILKVHAKDVLMDDTVDLKEIALATSGAVGSDLANMINEAAINAVKMGRRYVSQKDLFDAVEQVLVGKEKKDRIMSKEERRIVSYHETGHALVSALQKNSEPVQKITIVPRTMGALGYVMQVPEEEKYLNTEAELRDMLVGLVAGRAAEEIVFDTVTTGASNDIEKATNIARAMVTQYGMSKKFGLVGLESVESKYLDGRTVMNCSDSTAADVDAEVMKLLKESYKEAKHLLKDNRKLLDKLAEYLIEKETITGKEFMKIYRKEKGLPEPKEEEQEEQKPDQNLQPAPQGIQIPGNYGRPQAGGFRQGPPIPRQNGRPMGNMPQGNSGSGYSQPNSYQNGMPGNPCQNDRPGGNMPQGNAGREMPPQNPYQNGQPWSGETDRQTAWDAQYRQNHWSNQPNPYQNGVPASQPNPYQNGMPAGQPNSYQNGMPTGQPNPYQNGMPASQPNPYQSGMSTGQSNPHQSGISTGQSNPHQSGMSTDLQKSDQQNAQGNRLGQLGQPESKEAGERQNERSEFSVRGEFSGVLKDVVEQTDKPEFVPYEDFNKAEDTEPEAITVEGNQKDEPEIVTATENRKDEPETIIPVDSPKDSSGMAGKEQEILYGMPAETEGQVISSDAGKTEDNKEAENNKESEDNKETENNKEAKENEETKENR